MRKSVLSIVAVGSLLLGAGAVQAAEIPFVNEFDTAGFTNQHADYSLDTGAGVLNLVVDNITTSTVYYATEQITNVTSEGFRVSSLFTVNSYTNNAGNPTFGFSILGDTSDNSGVYYLADWYIGEDEDPEAGTLRIVSAGGANADFSGTEVVTHGIGAVPVGTYELVLTGSYDGLGGLDMTLQVLDELGNQIGSTATASDLTPLTGQYFGYRNRVAGTASGNSYDLSFENFAVVVPEPASLVLMGLGGLMMLRRRKA